MTTVEPYRRRSLHLTRTTLPGLLDTAGLPRGSVSLEPVQPLHPELALRPQDEPALRETLDALYDARLPLRLPGPRYPAQVASSLRHELQLVHDCFGGDGLAFIEPARSGTVRRAIASPPIRDGRGPARITGTTAAQLFPLAARPGPCDCPLYSEDCVNMWPLMEDFDGSSPVVSRRER